jgi:hypothetical protein
MGIMDELPMAPDPGSSNAPVNWEEYLKRQPLIITRGQIDTGLSIFEDCLKIVG